MIQGSCTRIKTFVDAIASAPIMSAITAQLEERRARFDSHWSEYESVQTQIELQDESESNHRAGFEEAFYALAARMRELLNTNARRQSAVLFLATTRTPDASEYASQVRLPRLNLPIFSGNYEE